MESVNKSIKLKRSIILLILAVAVFGCKKGSSPAPTPLTPGVSKVSFGVKAVNSTTPIALNSAFSTSAVAATPAIQFTAGIANISKFKLEAKTATRSVEIETKNLMNIDLFAITPAVVSATLDTGTYKEIEVRVELAQTADTSAIPLTLKGTFTAPDGSATPIELIVNQNLTIKAEAKNVVLHNTGDLSTIVMLHLDKIIAGITASDLAGATKTGGVIIISSASNAAIFNKISFNVENCGDTQVEQENGNDHGGNDGSNHN